MIDIVWKGQKEVRVWYGRIKEELVARLLQASARELRKKLRIRKSVTETLIGR